MAKIREPKLFSEEFGVDAQDLKDLGAFDPTLNVDTKLFIDFFLLESSKAPEVSENSYTRLITHFENVLTLLKTSSAPNDLSWREAHRRMSFHEISTTSLGYGAGSTHGSGWGPVLTGNVLRTASEIIELGVKNPLLFALLPLIEQDIGPDRISDMVTRVILPDLIEFTQRVSQQLAIPTESLRISGASFELPRNPTEKKRTPVILVPRDVLRDLPTASDWSEIADAASENAALRRQVNEFIGEIWLAKTRKEKAKLRNQVLSSREAFQTLIDCVEEIESAPYDLDSDPAGLVEWRTLIGSTQREHPFHIQRPATFDADSLLDIVRRIVEQFRHLVEDKGVNRLLWHKGKNRTEKSSQLTFFAIADSYCQANNIDVTPEADTGVGTVDFKFSTSYEARVLVEIKLSTNSKLVAGYEKQLEAYRVAEDTARAIFLVIDVGSMGTKDERLLALKNKKASEGHRVSEVIFVDGMIKPTASKR
jgi:hypothetical protein